MSIIEAIILGLVQGLTEFIPVSSSGHLVLFHHLLGIDENGLAFDVALHFGTLIALLIYFRNDLFELAKSLFVKSEKTKLAYLLIVATIPAVISGFLLEGKVESAFRSIGLVAVNFILISMLMLLAEWWYAKHVSKKTDLEHVQPKQAIAVGVAQAMAVVPGISRSGTTILTGLFVGFDRVSAARFSFLLGVPIMMGAIAAVLLNGESIQTIQNDKAIFIVGVLTALTSGLAAIVFLLRFLAKHTLKVFAYYRLVVGLGILLYLALR